MGLLTKILGGGVDKNALIKNLIMYRVQSDPILASKYSNINEEIVNSLSRLKLLGFPEATIVTIVETWSNLSKKGVPEDEILYKIEQHRSRFSSGGHLPFPLNLESYIKYRLNIEHSSGVPIGDNFITKAIEAARTAYSGGHITPRREPIEDLLDSSLQCLKKGDYSKALSEINKLLNFDPRNARGFNVRGTIFLKVKKYRDAIDDYTHQLHKNCNLKS